jgi:two-component system LytT family response regulator
VVVALYSAQVFLFYADTPDRVTLARALTIAVQDIVVWLVLMPAVLYLQGRIGESGAWPWHGIAGPAFAILHVALDAAINLASGQLSVVTLLAVWQQSLPGMLFVNLLVYAAIVLTGMVLALRARLAERDGSADTAPRTLVIRHGRDRRVVPLGDIIWIESANNHVGIHTPHGSWVSRDTLARLERILPAADFVRVHRSALVNIAWIHEFRSGSHGDGDLVLRDEVRVRVSRRFRAALESRLAL